MERRQNLLSYVVRTIIDYQIDQKRHKQLADVTRPYPYRIVPPSLTAGELLSLAEGLYNVTQAVLDMVARGGISMQEARRTWYAYGLQEQDMPDNLNEQIQDEIEQGVIRDPLEVVDTTNDPSKGAPGRMPKVNGSNKDNQPGDAKRGKRSQIQNRPKPAARG